MQALGKEFLNFYLGNFFAEGYHAGPRQSIKGYGQSPRQRPEKF